MKRLIVAFLLVASGCAGDDMFACRAMCAPRLVERFAPGTFTDRPSCVCSNERYSAAK